MVQRDVSDPVFMMRWMHRHLLDMQMKSRVVNTAGKAAALHTDHNLLVRLVRHTRHILLDRAGVAHEQIDRDQVGAALEDIG